MPEIGKMVSLLGIIFLLLGLLFNIIMPRLPKIPGDIYIDRGGFRVYIPWVSSLVIAVFLTLLFNFFRK